MKSAKMKVFEKIKEGSRVEATYICGDDQREKVIGVVLDNDMECSLVIETEDGELLGLDYSDIKMVKTLKDEKAALAPSEAPAEKVQESRQEEAKQAPKAAQQLLYECNPVDVLKVSDAQIKEYFRAMSHREQQKLTSAYDAFSYGVKTTDKERMKMAARRVRGVFFDELDGGHDWSDEAIRFCSCLTERGEVSEPEIPLTGSMFYESSCAAASKGSYALSAAYALLALGDPQKEEDLENLLVLLTRGMVRAGDISGLGLGLDCLPEELEGSMRRVFESLCIAKNVKMDPEEDLHAVLEKLEAVYPGTEMGEEVTCWVDMEPPQNEQDAPPVQEGPQVVQTPVRRHGYISSLAWSEHTGTITSEEGEKFTFTYKDLSGEPLRHDIENCMRMDLGGELYVVSFLGEGSFARAVQTDGNPAARVIELAGKPARREYMMQLCQRAMKSSEGSFVLVEMVKQAENVYRKYRDKVFVETVVKFYEENENIYPGDKPSYTSNVARLYGILGNNQKMASVMERANAMRWPECSAKLVFTKEYMGMMRVCYESANDKGYLMRLVQLEDAFHSMYKEALEKDDALNRRYLNDLLSQRVQAEIELGRLETAQNNWKKLPEGKEKERLEAMLETACREARAAEEEKRRLEEKEAHTPEALETEPDEHDEAEEDPEDEIEVRPYVDSDGWEALGLTKKDLVDRALSFGMVGHVGAMMACLRAGAKLNDEIQNICRTVALAVNDPLSKDNDKVGTLLELMASGDTDYHELNGLCIGASYLRSSFRTAETVCDYNAKSLRTSIPIYQELPELQPVFDLLARFYAETNRPIDIYADYRNMDVKKLDEDIATTVNQAADLYQMLVMTPPREGASFERMVITKKLIYDREGYLGTMLSYVASQNAVALEDEKENFVNMVLNGVPEFSPKNVSDDFIEETIDKNWVQAGRGLRLQKTSKTLQGDRRNNLRVGVRKILNLLCQWYDLAEQSAGVKWRTASGEAAYQAMRPHLLSHLRSVAETCEEMMTEGSVQRRAGLRLLSNTARELASRLDGSWKFGQEKFLYVDFLRSNYILLNENFMPELDATFCVLPQFNIIQRISDHVEDNERTFQEQIDRIYGPDKACSNYGTAKLICTYLKAMGREDEVELPEDPERFVKRTKMQVKMSWRSFRETYALATSYGQIIKSDAFCHTLEDTARYWYARCRTSGNYGFFVEVLFHAEEQIHASARQYEQQLETQLEALVSSNQAYFDTHPDYTDAILGQISNQNFTVAEDWMARIRLGDFSLEVQPPEALGYLEDFWKNYSRIYPRIADPDCPMQSLLESRDGSDKDAKGAQLLLDSWMHNGKSNSARMTRLLNQLGWQDMEVQSFSFAGSPRTEIYEAWREQRTVGLAAPLHPIAAFGSVLEKKKMFAVCLYGVYDCDRLFEKIRTLDLLEGNKVILLDYALGQVDRRALARKLKQRENGLRNVYLVVDRVLIAYLAENYNENLINRILMATAMPFSYCQPYVVESVHTMPPEIFIGRKDELLRIEQSDGVNLIYGGRQLGKSALLKKALADLDGHEHCRAALVDIRDLNCAEAARKISGKLIDLKITPEGEITEDWTELCRNIERRLRQEDNEIPYFLLMLDEADAFIDDCAKCGYRPLAAMKDVQQSLPGQFKYVLAGLHNIVRFNRQVALGSNSVITHMPSLKITPFRTPEAQELLTMPLSYLGFSLPSRVTVSQILATCNYFPGLIQLYAKKLIESVRSADYAGYDVRMTPPYLVTDEHLRRVMSDEEFVQQIHEKFEITLMLDQDQGSFYYPLTLLIGWMYSELPSKGGYTAQEVLRYARDLPVYPLADLDEEKIDALLQELQDLNILRSVSNNSYLLASKNFRDLLGSYEEICSKLDKFTSKEDGRA